MMLRAPASLILFFLFTLPFVSFSASTNLSVSVVGGVTSVCNDGLDNDADSLVDYPADPGCTGATDEDEFNATPPPATTTTPILGGVALGLFGSTNPLGVLTQGALVFSGSAPPGGVVSVLKDGIPVKATPVSSSGAFSVTLSDLSAGSYVFTLVATDREGGTSRSQTVAVAVGAQLTTSVAGISFGPTLAQSDATLERGSGLYVYGYTTPGRTIVLHIDDEVYRTTTADGEGRYRFIFDTEAFVPSPYQFFTRDSETGELSRLSSVIITPSRVTPPTQETVCSTLRGDLNDDCRVSIADFSIASFWYLRTAPPPWADLNGDGLVTIVDFSIMMSNWTG